MTANTPRYLFLDIETAPLVATVWDLWGVNVGIDQLLTEKEILSIAYAWLDSDDIHFTSKWKHGNRGMLRKIHKALSEADCVVTYNGDKFDLKVINASFAKAGMAPPPPVKSADLIKTVKKHFRLPSYKLDYVLRYFGLGKKIRTPGHQLWLDVMNKDQTAYSVMQEYNEHDVRVTKELFKFLRGWGIVGIPNHSAFTGELVCPECGGSHYHQRGTRMANMLRYARYRCVDCGKWFSGNKTVDKRGGARMVPYNK